MPNQVEMLDWKPLTELDQVSVIDQDSHSSVQAIFKHSTTCPISHMAKNRVETNWKLPEVTAYYLDLKMYRAISAAIADRWNVQHESPQIIVVKEGKVIYHESHLDIDTDKIARSLHVANVNG